MRLYHGGYPGLSVGDDILCPDQTGTDHRLSARVPADAPHGTRTDRVYVTSEREAARTYAAFYPDGALYEVSALGDMEPDPDAPQVSWMVERAVVKGVVDPVVLFRARTPEKWLRALRRTAENPTSRR